MKLQCSKSRTLRGWRAFTLVEVMIASVAIIILIGSVIMCNLYGLAMAVRQQIWLGASDDAAQAVSKLMGDIRAANTLQVGTYTSNVFTQTAATNQQSGNALLIFSTTNTALATGPWTLYYYNVATNMQGLNSNSLVRTNFYGAGIPGDCKLVSANPITNDYTHPIFTEVDSTGTPLSTATPVASVSVYLSFTKLQDPQVVIESGSVVDFYQITITVTPRI
jgi:Tfp pilus assembly protein PilV